MFIISRVEIKNRDMKYKPKEKNIIKLNKFINGDIYVSSEHSDRGRDNDRAKSDIQDLQ